MVEIAKDLLSSQKVLLYDPKKCTGCRYCEIACSFYHFRRLDLKRAHLHISFNEDRFEFEASVCQHCEEPLCLAACPSDAITKDQETGWVRINPVRCIGCRTCTFICPLSAPWFNEDYKISMKCDFCNGDPQCARFCSPQAIRVVTREEAWEYNKKSYGEG